MFTKYLSRDKGLAIGFIPCNEEELIWFLQFDATLCTMDLSSPEAISEFCTTIVNEFPDEVRELMACESVMANYVWHTTDFEVLPTFHSRNVLLLGDAAHVALPFTSAGVTNALLDVDCFMKAISENPSFEYACKTVYLNRAPQVKNHVEIGRQIRSSFLQGSDQSVKLPIIQDLKVLAD
jgi:2-polyprenyl-6-methoxyphenol hydroxylase-like FAD-dependent oxidoreductase